MKNKNPIDNTNWLWPHCVGSPRFSEIATKNVSKIKIKLTHRLVINLPSHSTESTELEGKAMLNCFVCIGVLAQLLMCTLYQKF